MSIASYFVESQRFSGGASGLGSAVRFLVGSHARDKTKISSSISLPSSKITGRLSCSTCKHVCITQWAKYMVCIGINSRVLTLKI